MVVNHPKVNKKILVKVDLSDNKIDNAKFDELLILYMLRKMVLHAGIICYKKIGKFIIYNSVTKEQTIRNVLAVSPDNHNGVDEIFKSVESLVNDRLGCLCICLGIRYDNEIREKFIQAGKDFGFYRVQITDWQSADYCGALSTTDVSYNQKLKAGDVIWIFSGRWCRMWQKEKDKARYIKGQHYNDSLESLKIIQNSTTVAPDVIIYGSHYHTSPEILEQFFKISQVRVYTSFSQENGVIVKARIMAGDNDVMCYDTETLFERHVSLKIGETLILSAKMWTPLPYSAEKVVEKPDGHNCVEVSSHIGSYQKHLPNARKFAVKLKIDINGIYKINLNPKIQHESSQNPAAALSQTRAFPNAQNRVRNRRITSPEDPTPVLSTRETPSSSPAFTNLRNQNGFLQPITISNQSSTPHPQNLPHINPPSIPPRPPVHYDQPSDKGQSPSLSSSLRTFQQPHSDVKPTIPPKHLPASPPSLIPCLKPSVSKSEGSKNENNALVDADNQEPSHSVTALIHRFNQNNFKHKDKKETENFGFNR